MIRLYILFLSSMLMLAQNLSANTYSFWQNIEINVNSLADVNTNTTYNLFSNDNNSLFGQTGIKFDDDDFVASQGLGYRYFSSSKIFMFGANTVYDWKILKNNHYQRLSFGLEFRFPYVSLTSNYYLPLSKEKKISKSGVNYITGAYSGYDLELSGNIPLWKGSYLNRLDLSVGLQSWSTNTKSKLGVITLKGYETFKKQTAFSIGTDLYIAYGIELFLKQYFKNSKDSSSISTKENETEFGLKYVYNFDDKSRKIANTNPAQLEQYRFKRITRDYNIKLYAGEEVIDKVDTPVTPPTVPPIYKGDPILRADSDEYPDISSVLLFSDEGLQLTFDLGREALDTIDSCDLYSGGVIVSQLTVVDGSRCTASTQAIRKFQKNLSSRTAISLDMSAQATGKINGVETTTKSQVLNVVVIEVDSVTVNTDKSYIDGVEGKINAHIPLLSALGHEYNSCEALINKEAFNAILSDGQDALGNNVKVCSYSFTPKSNKMLNVGFKFYTSIGDITTSSVLSVDIDVIGKNTLFMPSFSVFASDKQKILATFNAGAIGYSETKTNICKLVLDGNPVADISYYRKLDTIYCYKDDFSAVDYMTDPTVGVTYSVGILYNDSPVVEPAQMTVVPDPGKQDANGNFKMDGTLTITTSSKLVAGIRSMFEFTPKGIDFSVNIESCSVTINNTETIRGNPVSNKDCVFGYIPKNSGDIDIKITYTTDFGDSKLIYNVSLTADPAPIIGNVIFEKPKMKLGETQKVTVEIITDISPDTAIYCNLLDENDKVHHLPVVGSVAVAGVSSGKKVCTFTDFNPQQHGFGVGVARIFAEVVFEEFNDESIRTEASSLELTP